jgi:DNA replication protein DnaC
VQRNKRARDTVNLARCTRTACLGTCKPLDRFGWAHPGAIDRPLIERLMTLEFVAANVLIKGGSGVGKTMIAQNVGLAGLAAGYTVRFASLATALAECL